MTGHAVDVIAYLGASISWEWKYYEQIAVAFKPAGKELGTVIKWGGEWKTLKDGPHFQLSVEGLPSMTGWLQKLMQGGLVLWLLVAVCLGGYSSLLSHRLALARQQVAEQQRTLAQQAKLITSLRTDDARNRALMAEQQRREQQLRQQGENYRRKYQDAIKNDECARRTAPGAVLGLLRGTDIAAAGAARAVSP